MICSGLTWRCLFLPGGRSSCSRYGYKISLVLFRDFHFPGVILNTGHLSLPTGWEGAGFCAVVTIFSTPEWLPSSVSHHIVRVILKHKGISWIVNYLHKLIDIRKLILCRWHMMSYNERTEIYLEHSAYFLCRFFKNTYNYSDLNIHDL